MLGLPEALETMAQILDARFGFTFGPKDKAKTGYKEERTAAIPMPIITDDMRDRVRNYKYVCAKCGRRPETELDYNPENQRVEIRFRCHGEIDLWQVSQAILNTIRTPNPALFRIAPFSRLVPPGFSMKVDAKPNEQGIIPKKEWNEAIAGEELPDTGDNNGVWMDDEGNIYGKGRVGAMVRMQNGKILGRITAYQPDRKSVIINVEGRGPTEFPALNPSILPPPGAFWAPRKPVLKTKLSYDESDEQPEPTQMMRPPGMRVYYNGQMTTIDCEGMTDEIRRAVAELANSAPGAFFRLLKAGAFRFEEAPTYLGRSNIKESELRTIDLKAD